MKNPITFGEEQRDIMKKKSDEYGYTLIELLTVLVIISILAAVTVPSMVGFIEEARKKSYLAEAKLVCDATQIYITQVYAMGKLSEMDVQNALLNHDLGDERNPLSEMLRGNYTKGARISGIGLDENEGKLFSFTYTVQSYEIEITVGKEVKVKPAVP